MYSRFLRFKVGLAGPVLAALLVVPLSARDLRVCADPNNLPFSNERAGGFENRVAEVLAQELDARLVYTWWSQRKSFVKNSLGAGMCDVIVGLPPGYPGVLATRPWYRSTYVLLSRAGTTVRSLEDPAPRKLRIGAHVVGENFSPPADELADRGITNIAGYSLFGAAGEVNPAARLVEALEHRDIDVAVVWGPFAGYFARQSHVPMQMTRVPFEFDIAVAVRPGEEALRDELQRALDRRRADIRAILDRYGVPLCELSSAAAPSSR